MFLEHSELHSLGKQKLLRALEQLSIVGRDKRPAEQPLPFKGVPLYFRRAAINAAVNLERKTRESLSEHLSCDKQNG